jgi:hypothetical protein
MGRFRQVPVSAHAQRLFFNALSSTRKQIGGAVGDQFLDSVSCFSTQTVFSDGKIIGSA